MLSLQHTAIPFIGWLTRRAGAVTARRGFGFCGILNRSEFRSTRENHRWRKEFISGLRTRRALRTSSSRCQQYPQATTASEHQDGSIIGTSEGPVAVVLRPGDGSQPQHNVYRYRTL